MATAVETAPPPVVADKAPAAPTPAPSATPAVPAAAAPASAATAPASPAAPEAKASLLADAPKAPAAPEASQPAVKPAEAATEWKLEVPKDSGLTPDHLKAVETFAREQQMTAAQAQKLIDRDAAAKVEFAKQGKAEYDKQYATWQAASEKEFGAKMPEIQDSAKRAIRQYGDDEFRTLLSKTPYGNFPPLLRFLAKIGDGLREDVPTGGNVNPPKPVDPVRAFYGDDHTKPTAR